MIIMTKNVPSYNFKIFKPTRANFYFFSLVWTTNLIVRRTIADFGQPNQTSRPPDVHQENICTAYCKG